MRYTSDHKTGTRNLVLQHASRQILAGGIDSIRIAEIMSKAGLTHGGFYAHFDSKEDLLISAVEMNFAKARVFFLGHVSGKSPAEGLRSYIDGYLSTRHRDSIDEGCPVPHLLGSLPAMSEGVRERFTRQLSRWIARIAVYLRKMGHSDAADMAASFIAELVGTLSLARALGPTKRSDEVLRRSRASLKKRLVMDQRS